MKGVKLIEACYLIAVLLAIGGLALSVKAYLIPVAEVLLLIGLASLLAGLLALVLLRRVAQGSKTGGKGDK